MNTVLTATSFALCLKQEHYLLRDASFSVLRGERLGVLGVSGSGKSLLAWALLGLLPDDAAASGSLVFSGNEGRDYDLLKPADTQYLRGKQIVLIPQNTFTSLNPSMTCLQQIREITDLDTDSIAGYLTSLGLEDPLRVLGAYPHELSGGQLQRVLVTMATVSNPVLIVADEPTTALDNTTERETLDLLIDWHERNSDSALILISHDPAVINHVTSRQLLFEDQKLVEVTGSPVAYNPANRAAGKPQNGAVTPDSEGILELRSVSKSFRKRNNSGTTKALQEISMTVARGDMIGLVGDSGSGKSTLARVICGLIRPDQGSLLFHDEMLDFVHDRNLRIRLQMVFQDPYNSLYPSRTVDYILNEALGQIPKTKGTASYGTVSELLAAVELPDSMRWKYPHQLSGGEKQRVQIARALALDPEILICDESVSGLDRPVQKRILDILRTLNRRDGLAVVIITHDLDVVEYACEIVHVMHDGCIVESGRTVDVLSHPASPATKRLLHDRLKS